MLPNFKHHNSSSELPFLWKYSNLPPVQLKGGNRSNPLFNKQIAISIHFGKGYGKGDKLINYKLKSYLERKSFVYV